MSPRPFPGVTFSLNSKKFTFKDSFVLYVPTYEDLPKGDPINFSVVFIKSSSHNYNNVSFRYLNDDRHDREQTR